MPPQTQQSLTQPLLNPVASKLFSTIGNAPAVTTNVLKRGSLIVFGYSMWKHDPHPLLIVTDFISNNRVRGINLHYLTFPYIRNILRMGANNPTFSYRNIKADAYIVSAFRSYKWQGIRQIKMLDSAFLLTVMVSVRSFDPTQIKAIRKAVQDQIMRQVNPKPTPTNVASTEQPEVEGQ